MGNGYTRQSSAEIVTGNTIEANPLNLEFNQLQSAFNGVSGHSHDGTTGEGPKISLANSVSGILKVENGGSGGINKVDATVAPTVNDDILDGYVVGSYWIDTVAKTVYTCVSNTAGAAEWKIFQPLDGTLTGLAAVVVNAADRLIYSTGTDLFATTALTPFARTLIDDTDASSMRTTLGLGSMSTQNSNSVSITGGSVSGATINTNSATITGGSISGITDLAIADGGTGASTITGAKTNLGLENVDNTSDLNKPVSNATQTALNLKANIASPTFTGAPAAPTASSGTNTTQLATTEFVQSEVGFVKNGLSGYRNKIINGNFDFWQRGTTSGSWVAPILNYYVADRWVAQSNGTGGTGLLSRQSFTPGQTDVPGNPSYFLRWQITSAASGQSVGSNYLEQRIEDVKTLSGRKATVTFYLKGSGTLPSINLVQGFGSGGSSLVVTQLATNVVMSGSWTKVQYVVNIPSISGKTVGSDSYIALNFNVPVNTTYTLDLAHVSIVDGDCSTEADSFSERSLVEEFNLCLRYYESRTFRQSGYRAAGNTITTRFPWGIRKRITPAISVQGGSVTNITSSGIAANTESFWGTGTATATGFIELNRDFIADAEL